MASTIKVNNIQNQCGANIANKCGSTITLGASGDTITLACGASQTGFGRTGTVDWDTTAKTASFTAVSGTGYFVNTTSGAVTMTLPATPSAGDIVAVSDYANTSVINNITVARNGSNIEGNASDLIIANNGIALTFIYVDGTRGWKVTGAGKEADKSSVSYMIATGGTETTCGDYKIHTFTGPGTFTVCTVGDFGEVDYVVVAGGGGGGQNRGGGGGAGGYREAHCSTISGSYTASPLATSTSLPISAAGGYPITVGGGGGGAPACSPDTTTGSKGSDSVFSTITSTGGGGGGNRDNTQSQPGGSGGGAAGGSPPADSGGTAGTGNTPPVSPPQGNSGGSNNPPSQPLNSAAGGGGAGAAGGNAPPSDALPGGDGGAGVGTQINPAVGVPGPSCLVYFAGGGGGGPNDPGPSGSPTPQIPAASGGIGGGGDSGVGFPGPAGIPVRSGQAGTTNTGGGGGGSASPGTSSNGGAGGSGIVIIRYKYQ